MSSHVLTKHINFFASLMLLYSYLFIFKIPSSIPILSLFLFIICYILYMDVNIKAKIYQQEAVWLMAKS